MTSETGISVIVPHNNPGDLRSPVSAPSAHRHAGFRDHLSTMAHGRHGVRGVGMGVRVVALPKTRGRRGPEPGASRPRARSSSSWTPRGDRAGAIERVQRFLRRPSRVSGRLRSYMRARLRQHGLSIRNLLHHFLHQRANRRLDVLAGCGASGATVEECEDSTGTIPPAIHRDIDSGIACGRLSSNPTGPGSRDALRGGRLGPSSARHRSRALPCPA